MENPGLPNELWSILNGGLWHATDPATFRKILSSQEIRIIRGRYDNSLCKSLDAVSLFDFGTTSVDYPPQFNNWYGWFGSEQGSRITIWIEIDRTVVQANLLDAGRAHTLSTENLRYRFIPGVEACHTGPIPISAISKFLMIDHHDQSRFQIELQMDDFDSALLKFETCLPPPPPEPPLVRAHRLAEARRRNNGRGSSEHS